MPLVVSQRRHPELFERVERQNLLRQYDYLEQAVEVTLQLGGHENRLITAPFLRALNQYAVANISPAAGELRNIPVYIGNSPHRPPPCEEVARHLAELAASAAEMWDGTEGLQLAALVLWRVNWIHPFEEGNGRTARAASYFVLCVKAGMWLPGTNTIPRQIRENPAPYYAALRRADETFAHGAVDLGPLVALLAVMLERQLRS